MGWKDWGVPLVAATIAFAGLSALPGRQAHPQPEEGTLAVFPFPQAKANAGDTIRTLVLLRPQVAGADDACPHLDGARSDGAWTMEPGKMALDCRSDRLALFEVPVGEQTSAVYGRRLPGPAQSFEVKTALAGPRLGLDGYNATRATVHVFDARGELIASNGGGAHQAALAGTYAPEQLPRGVWYLGSAQEAPPGTQPLPVAARALLPTLRPLLAGLPVGGIATTETDALAGLYGTLYLTAQVDELVFAP